MVFGTKVFRISSGLSDTPIFSITVCSKSGLFMYARIYLIAICCETDGNEFGLSLYITSRSCLNYFGE